MRLNSHLQTVLDTYDTTDTTDTFNGKRKVNRVIGELRGKGKGEG